MPYERFDARRQAHLLALELYRMTDGWPRAERFELTGQLRRAALSVPANIAEGVARQGTRELKRYLAIALSSYFPLFARDRQLLGDVEWKQLDSLRSRVGQLVWGLLRAIRRRDGERARGRDGETGTAD